MCIHVHTRICRHVYAYTHFCACNVSRAGSYVTCACMSLPTTTQGLRCRELLLCVYAEGMYVCLSVCLSVYIYIYVCVFLVLHYIIHVRVQMCIDVAVYLPVNGMECRQIVHAAVHRLQAPNLLAAQKRQSSVNPCSCSLSRREMTQRQPTVFQSSADLVLSRSSCSFHEA